MISWCFSASDSATTTRTPPGRSSFTNVTIRWMARIRRSRIGRTLLCPFFGTRLQVEEEFAYTFNSPPTGPTKDYASRRGEMIESADALTRLSITVTDVEASAHIVHSGGDPPERLRLG